jgi:2'-5' RNA ligase
VKDAVRAFVALPLDAPTRERVVRAVEPLRDQLRGVRWSALSSFHVTLRFLGEASREVLERLHEHLGRAAAVCPRVRARLPRLGLFPERGSPRVLWLSVEPGPELLELQTACEAAATGAGFAPEAKPFRPHLTLGRWRFRVPRPALPPLDLGEAPLERLVLFESRLDPEGARHSELAAWPLGGGRA